MGYVYCLHYTLLITNSTPLCSCSSRIRSFERYSVESTCRRRPLSVLWPTPCWLTATSAELKTRREADQCYETGSHTGAWLSGAAGWIVECRMIVPETPNYRIWGGRNRTPHRTEIKITMCRVTPIYVKPVSRLVSVSWHRWPPDTMLWNPTFFYVGAFSLNHFFKAFFHAQSHVTNAPVTGTNRHSQNDQFHFLHASFRGTTIGQI